MKHPPIIVYEPPRPRDPVGEVVFAWFLAITFSWFILYSGISWMWEEAFQVIRDPFAAPLYSLLVCAICLSAGGLVLWAVCRALLVASKAGRAIVFFIEDVACLIATRLERARDAIVRLGCRR